MSAGTAPVTRPGGRRAERPAYDDLVADIADLGWEAVGRKYGVSGNAVRKWVRSYEREADRQRRNAALAEEEDDEEERRDAA